MDVAVEEYFDVVGEIINRGGPDVSEYEFIKRVPQELSNSASLEKQLQVHNLFAPFLTVDTMLGFTFQKPHGYAGDFELIDRIYSRRRSEDENLTKWDDFYHSLEATEAVRNRKKYFRNLAHWTQEKNNNARILNLGSGPCSDLLEFLKTKPNSKHTLKFECLDMDQKAIDYGSTVCDNYMDHITFIKKNALRFKPDYQYDLVWSAGLFDYFNDKIFIRLVNRIYSLVKSGGELVIGNFSTNNPSREIMEVYGQWYLHHRNEETLIDLAIKAGVPKNQIKVSQEAVGVNLFLHLNKF